MIHENGSAGVRWRRSSFSQGSGQTCVDVAFDGKHVLVHDSKHPEGPSLVFSRRERDVFLAGARAGEFDPDSPRRFPG